MWDCAFSEDSYSIWSQVRWIWRFRAVFRWLSKVITRLPLLRLVIAFKISHEFFNRWEAKPKPIAPCTRDFSRALSKLDVIARSSDWLIAQFAPVVVGRNNYLVLVFRQSLENSFRVMFSAGACFSKVLRTFRVRKASCQTAVRLFWKADLLTCFYCKKNQEDDEVWWLRTSALRRYKKNCGPWKVSGLLRNRPQGRFELRVSTHSPTLLAQSILSPYSNTVP